MTQPLVATPPGLQTKLEIPFEAFSILDPYCTILDYRTGIEGHLTGTFFLDDVRPLADTPQITTIEVYSWGQIKTGLSEWTCY